MEKRFGGNEGERSKGKERGEIRGGGGGGGGAVMRVTYMYIIKY